MGLTCVTLADPAPPAADQQRTAATAAPPVLPKLPVVILHPDATLELAMEDESDSSSSGSIKCSSSEGGWAFEKGPQKGQGADEPDLERNDSAMIHQV